MAPPKNAVAITPGGAITEQHIIGDYFWFNIPDQAVSEITVKRNMKAAELPEEWIPRSRQPAHVAQEAIRSVEGDRSNGVKRRVIVAEVAQDERSLIYQVTLQTWDKELAVIEHEKSMRVIFDKALGDFEAFDHLEAYEPLKGLEGDIREHFEQHASKMPGHKIRTIIRHGLEKAGATNMSESGKSAVYFMEHKEVDLLRAAQTFISATYTGRGLHSKGNLHIVPVVNDEGQRELIRRKFVETCDDDMRNFRDRLLDLVRTKDQRVNGFRSDLISNLIEERKKLTERRSQFEGILNENLSALDQSAKLADKALTKLLEEAA